MPTVAAGAGAVVLRLDAILARPRAVSARARPSIVASRRRGRGLVLVASFDEFDAKGWKPRHSASKKSILSNLIQEIEPLDVNLVQKDVPANTVDAMKRTISSMLGLLPSDQFHVLVEAFWEPLFKLLVSSMRTGYTLRNAEYRLCLEKTLDGFKEHSDTQKAADVEHDSCEIYRDRTINTPSVYQRSESCHHTEETEESPLCEDTDVEGLGEVSPEAREYILNLQSRLTSTKKELYDVKRKNAALQMQHFVGEEKNDLLDYLRSLQPEKVAELSEATCPGVQEAIHSVAHGLLATLSPKLHTKAPPLSENASSGNLNIGKDDFAELVENTSLQFQPQISVSRDYLARLLFWCMLLGHYLRGLEYRLELMQMFKISGDVESRADDGDNVV